MDKIQEPLDAAAFRRPPMQFRGVPFFAWNCKLDRALLLREIDCFREMGFGGFCIHVRTGLATPYMGTEFMEMVRECEAYGKERGMRTWLYDEDRWPSGAAGGEVTKNPELAQPASAFHTCTVRRRYLCAAPTAILPRRKRTHRKRKTDVPV